MASPCPHCGSTDGSDHLCAGAQLALIGQVLDGRYQIEDVLGQGGMGMVFRANQTSVHRPVAVKTLNPSLAAAPQFFERFRREAEIASRLRHPNVITIYDFGRAQDGTCYYVMELLEGESLRQLVKRDGPMTLRRAVDVVEQACRGLAHAHEQGAVHRDIKPHNIMVQQLDGRDFVKVLDFGLVKALEQEEEQQLTSTGQVLGTPQYMPPEQAGGEVVDHRSDLYSMGGVLYCCLTGTSPYGANTVRKALTAALTQQVPPVNAKRQGAPIPQLLEDVLQKSLAREKEDRFQSAQEFIDAMLDAVADLSPEEFDALPTGSSPDAGGSSRPSQRSVSRPGRSSPSAARSRPAGPGRGSQPSAGRSSQPSAARGSQPSAARGSQPSAARSASRSRSPVAEAPATQALTEPAESTSSGRKIALVAVPLLLIVAGGAFVMLRPSPESPAPSALPTPAPQSPPPPVETTVQESRLTVQFRSTPEGAAIFDGDVQIGTTPTELRLRRDKTHVLSFRLADHQSVERTLDFSRAAEDTQLVEVSLEKMAPVERSRPSTRPSRPAPSKEKEEISIFE